MNDKIDSIVDILFTKAHRFLSEDEVISATLNHDLSIIDSNKVIEKLLEKGVYISENIEQALHDKTSEKSTCKKDNSSKKTLSDRKSPEEPTTFKMLNIPVGSELVFLKDSNVKAITTDTNNQIKLYDGSIVGSISHVSRVLAVKYGYADTARQGPRWWYYRGKTLYQIRKEMFDE